jgi:hypothetical protein
MQFNSIGRSSNFAQAGKAAADDTLKAFIASRRNAPDYGKIVEKGMENRSAEKKAAMVTSAQVHRAGIKAKAGVQEDRILYGAKRKKDSAQRKAGALGAAGKMFAGIANAGGEKPLEPYKGRYSRDELNADIDKYSKEADDIRAGIVEPVKPSDAPSTSTPSPTGGGGGSTNSGGGSPITPSGGTVDRGEVYSYLTKDKGLSHNKAYGLMSNIDRESGFNASIRSGDDGGPGGLFQWKGVRQTPTVAKLVNSGDWKGQIDYALTEPGESSATTFLNTTWESPQAAASHWTRKWERPAHPDADVVKNNNFIAGYTYHQ